MSNEAENNGVGRAQFRADLPNDQELHEQEAVRTTIVGGRPPGSGKPMGNVPRGIEVLLKKAAVDLEFRELLLKTPEAAAKSIDLELAPVERAMLQSIPAEQLTVIIQQTEVPQQQRRAFLGKVAATMLAVLVVGAAVGSCSLGIRPGDESLSKGIRPEPEPPLTGGARADFPEESETPKEPQVE